MTCSKANITGGNIDMTAEREEVILRVHCIDWTGAEIESIITPGSFDVYNRNDYDVPLISVGTITYLDGEEGHIRITSNMDNKETKIYPGGVDFWSNGSHTYVGGDKIETPVLTQTSLESQKKNFEKLQNGLDIVNNTEIYKYNLKSQNDEDKKHIGFVIGKDYKYSSDITAIDDKGKEVGVDTYSMISVAYKAIQELTEKNEMLEKRIEKLEANK